MNLMNNTMLRLFSFCSILSSYPVQLLVDGDAADSRKSGGYSLKPGALDRASAGRRSFLFCGGSGHCAGRVMIALL